MRELPIVVTLLGLLLGLDGLLFWPAPAAGLALVLSLGCDALDGALARELDAVTELGARLDWTIDVALGYSIAWLCLPRGLACAWLCVLVWLQVSEATRGSHRVSGRTLVTAVALIWRVGGW